MRSAMLWLIATVATGQVPAGNPILETAKAATAGRDAGVSKKKPAGSEASERPGHERGHVDAGLSKSADAGVPTPVDAGIVAVAKPAAMAPEVKELVERVQAFYEKTQDFSADFRQDYTYKAFKRTQTSTGTVIYLKPAMMRWEYQKPSPKTFVLAGDRVYALDPEAMLLTRASISTNKLSASVTFLWGQGKLADEFAITKKACTTCGGTLLQLEPLKPDPRFQRVFLEVDGKTAQVLKSTVVDPDGSENAISFLQLHTNSGVDAGSFKLTPPPGTQVQDFLSGGTPPPTGAADAGR